MLKSAELSSDSSVELPTLEAHGACKLPSLIASESSFVPSLKDQTLTSATRRVERSQTALEALSELPLSISYRHIGGCHSLIKLYRREETFSREEAKVGGGVQGYHRRSWSLWMAASTSSWDSITTPVNARIEVKRKGRTRRRSEHGWRGRLPLGSP